MIHVESFKASFKNVRFARYRRFGVFVFDGHFDLIAVLFLIFGDDLPPPFSNVLKV
jgi:hypothetical protein